MKSLKQYIEDLVLATPLNTIGMGDAYATSDGCFSEPICAQPKPAKRLKRKKKRTISDFL